LPAAEDKRHADDQPLAQALRDAAVVAVLRPHTPHKAAALSDFFPTIYTFCATGCTNLATAGPLLTSDL
jgi:hypothetical protein